jgi:hypothetical protein
MAKEATTTGATKKRKTVDPNETERQKLERLMGIRVSNILSGAKNVANLATYSELTDDDVKAVRTAVEPKIAEMFAALENRSKPASAGGFALPKKS